MGACMQVRGEVQDLQHEWQQEKEDLLQAMRDQDRQAKLISMIINNFIPEEERIKLEDRYVRGPPTGNKLAVQFDQEMAVRVWCVTPLLEPLGAVSLRLFLSKELTRPSPQRQVLVGRG